MSGAWWVGVTTAVWLGILTSISPCPLATNVAAISFIGRRVGSPRSVALAGVLYTVGRTLVYIVLAALLVASLLSVPAASHVLQKWMNKLLGPLLILVGMVLAGLLAFAPRGSGVTARAGERIASWGFWGALPLGVVFALSFCPASAAIFFGSFVPVAIRCESPVFLPALYGAGTALPVVVFAVLIATGGHFVGKAFDRLTQFERWARYVTGVLFILVGIYFCLAFIYRVI